jgi:hypothetical protein
VFVLTEAKDMNFYQKLAELEKHNKLNKMATTKTLHVSLNFSPSDKLSDDKLVAIANGYMEKLGFGNQPYLVYKHEDAGHPHIHIVSTTIRKDGSRINTHNIGRNQSEKARKEIEQQYGLIKAERQQQLLKPGIKPVDVEKVIYGKSETKRSISNVVGAVFSQYKFASLPEFNAALKQFNVIADRGNEEGRIYKNRGLVYRILDANGNKVGVPIKASSISCKPILDNLEQKFAANETAKESLKPFVKIKLDECLSQSSSTMKDLMEHLKQKNICTLLRQNAEGRLYGITFVDNQNKCVFNGSDLGKSYSVTALQSRLGNIDEKIHEQVATKTGLQFPALKAEKNLKKCKKQSIAMPAKKESLLGILLSTLKQFDNTPSGLLQKKRKKKKKINL